MLAVRCWGLGLVVAWILGPWSAQAQSNEIEIFRQRFIKPQADSNTRPTAKSRLGERLFFDSALSINGEISCASCHNPQQEWTDNLALRVGLDGKPLRRRSPSLWNAGSLLRFFWDGRATQLEGQAAGPLFSEAEMGNTPENLVERLELSNAYADDFKQIYGDSHAEVSRIVDAIAAFERTIVDEPSRFDRFIAGETPTFTRQEREGFMLFNSPRVSCVFCHGGWRLTLDGFFDIGLKGSDRGRGEFYQIPMWDYSFKAPSLRRVSQRKFYMHDGRFSTLREVLDFYNRGGDMDRPTKPGVIRRLGLNEIELKQLEAFLRTL